MAYDYLGLTNKVLNRLNEVELTTSNFATATGFHSEAKNAVNNAIREINQAEFMWPFNHRTFEETLSAGQVEYTFPSDMKAVKWDSFRLRRDAGLSTPVNEARMLSRLSYEEYMQAYVDSKDKASTDGAPPRFVVRTLDFNWNVDPIPDQAYTIDYDYFIFPSDLINDTDTPSIPERFEYVIVDGAMYYTYMFRDNIESASIQFRKFERGLEDMRTILINDYVYAAPTTINQRRSNAARTSFGEW